MRRIVGKYWLTLTLAFLAGLVCWHFLPPEPRWLIPPLMSKPDWERLCLSQDGELLVTYQPTNKDNDLRKMRLWETAAGKLLGVLHDGPGQLESLAIAPDKRSLAVWWHDRRIDVWDLAGDVFNSPRPDGRGDGGEGNIVRPKHCFRAPDGWYPHVQVVYQPDGRLVHYGPEITSGKVWDAATRELVREFVFKEADYNGWTSGFSEYLVGSSPKWIHLWRLDTGKKEVVPHGGSIVSARATATGGIVVGFRPDDFDQTQVFCFYESESGAVHTLPTNRIDWPQFELSMDGRIAAMPMRDERPVRNWLFRFLGGSKSDPSARRVDFVDIRSGSVLSSLADAQRPRFAPDQRSIAVVGGQGDIRVYDWPLRSPWLWILGVAVAAGCGWRVLAFVWSRIRQRKPIANGPQVSSSTL
ncbi:MAG: hypothetical protein L0Y72_05860 [Gemmataceae bacterium]|nr:hypothetical protein [Gemmataceae bacterium]MCI0738550.1 hypothetical protein [Gemmataceae bacterium]